MISVALAVLPASSKALIGSFAVGIGSAMATLGFAAEALVSGGFDLPDSVVIGGGLTIALIAIRVTFKLSERIEQVYRGTSEHETRMAEAALDRAERAEARSEEFLARAQEAEVRERDALNALAHQQRVNEELALQISELTSQLKDNDLI